jgi:hypothetical protein
MNLNLTYTFPDKLKKLTYIFMGIGLLTLIFGYFLDSAPEGVEHYHKTRYWANVLINAFFFMGIGLAATFYLALKYVSEAAYATTYKRVTEAISSYLPVGGIILAVVIIIGALGAHHLYHWMDHEIYEKGSVHYDEKIAAKQSYFGWFFWLRLVLFLGGWCWAQRILRKRSLLEDQTGDLKLHFKNITTSAGFLVFFGFTESVAAWDWLMSLDVHWFSTMFGWYVFSGMWISAMISIIVLTLYLKDKGHLEFVNASHIHDLGKWMFAVSFLWSYLFFCQFMLIWYANIPEEVTFFQNRLETSGYMWLFWTVFFVNFALPMLFLMSRDAKRNRKYLMVVGFIIFIFHWLDVFLIVMPSTVASHWHLGLMELGMFLGFLGLFIYVVLNALAKAPLMPLKHPYMDESKHLHH